MMNNLYDSDFYAWTQQQAQLLRSKHLIKLDILHLAEEPEAMGRSENRELAGRLEVLLIHLLKWQFQSFCDALLHFPLGILNASDALQWPCCHMSPS
jgi:hypothetical protein